MKITFCDAAGNVKSQIDLVVWDVERVPPYVLQYKGEFYVRTSDDDCLDHEFVLSSGRSLNEVFEEAIRKWRIAHPGTVLDA